MSEGRQACVCMAYIHTCMQAVPPGAKMQCVDIEIQRCSLSSSSLPCFWEKEKEEGMHALSMEWPATVFLHLKQDQMDERGRRRGRIKINAKSSCLLSFSNLIREQ